MSKATRGITLVDARAALDECRRLQALLTAIQMHVRNHSGTLARHNGAFLTAVTSELSQHFTRSAKTRSAVEPALPPEALALVRKIGDAFPDLSPSERRVAWAIMEYRGMLERACALNLSPDTIRWHASSIRRKLSEHPVAGRGADRRSSSNAGRTEGESLRHVLLRIRSRNGW